MPQCRLVILLPMPVVRVEPEDVRILSRRRVYSILVESFDQTVHDGIQGKQLGTFNTFDDALFGWRQFYRRLPQFWTHIK